MRPEGVVIVFPARKRLAGMIERGEDRLVEQVVTEPAVEALDEGVLRRLAGRDLMPFELCLLPPAQDRRADELRPIVADDRQGLARPVDDGIEFTADPRPR